MADNVSIGKTRLIPKDGPGRAGFAIDKVDNRIKMRRGSTNNAVQPVACDAVILATGAITLKDKDDGTTVIADAAASVVVTLPVAKAGMKFSLVVKTLPGSGAGTTFQLAATDTAIGALTKTAGQTIVNSAASDAVGDRMDLIGVSSGVWFVSTVRGTWA